MFRVLAERPSKREKAEKLGIEMMSEEQFFAKYDELKGR